MMYLVFAVVAGELGIAGLHSIHLHAIDGCITHFLAELRLVAVVLIVAVQPTAHV